MSTAENSNPEHAKLLESPALASLQSWVKEKLSAFSASCSAPSTAAMDLDKQQAEETAPIEVETNPEFFEMLAKAAEAGKQGDKRPFELLELHNEAV